VQERLAAQKKCGSAAGDGSVDGAQHQGKGKHEAQLGLEAVKQLREECDLAVAAVSVEFALQRRRPLEQTEILQLTWGLALSLSARPVARSFPDKALARRGG
jgi:hypothetical protein